MRWLDILIKDCIWVERDQFLLYSFAKCLVHNRLIMQQSVFRKAVSTIVTIEVGNYHLVNLLNIQIMLAKIASNAINLLLITTVSSNCQLVFAIFQPGCRTN